jgi:hypothetical protein
MASAKAMHRIDCTIIFVEALGLRPTASEDIPPITPTPIAAPSAARPTHKFPLICSYPLSGGGTYNLAPAAENQNLRVPGIFFVLAHQKRKDSCQQHEDHRLNEAH